MTDKITDAAPSDNGQEIIHCDGCGCEGMKADTASGEIIVDGSVIGYVPDGVAILMVGDGDGRRTDMLLCDACAEIEAVI